MRCSPSASSFRLLCLWLTLACCQAATVTVRRIRADIKSLSETTMKHISTVFPAVSTRVDGLEFIPEDLPALNLQAMGQTLETFDQVLSNLPLQAPLDVEHTWRILEKIRKAIMGPGFD